MLPRVCSVIYSYILQMTSKCGKNKKVAHKAEQTHLMESTLNLFVLYKRLL